MEKDLLFLWVHYVNCKIYFLHLIICIHTNYFYLLFIVFLFLCVFFIFKCLVILGLVYCDVDLLYSL